jgi:hypothetical protein
MSLLIWKIGMMRRTAETGNGEPLGLLDRVLMPVVRGTVPQITGHG